MARPRTYSEDRTHISLRVPPDLPERLRAAAEERGLSTNTLTVMAIEDYLSRLIPVSELKLTR